MSIFDFQIEYLTEAFGWSQTVANCGLLGLETSNRGSISAVKEIDGGQAVLGIRIADESGNESPGGSQTSLIDIRSPLVHTNLPVDPPAQRDISCLEAKN